MRSAPLARVAVGCATRRGGGYNRKSAVPHARPRNLSDAARPDPPKTTKLRSKGQRSRSEATAGRSRRFAGQRAGQVAERSLHDVPARGASLAAVRLVIRRVVVDGEPGSFASRG